MRATTVKLLVWLVNDKGRRKLTISTTESGEPLTEQAANRMATGLYSGMRTRVIRDEPARQEPDRKHMRSASDKLWMNRTSNVEQYVDDWGERSYV